MKEFKTAASDSLGKKHYSDHPADDGGDIGGFDDYDIANRHDCNTELEKRPKVKQFFKEAREHESLADPKTRSWLGSLPLDMREEAIPLFVDREADYQLHPSYTWLELGRSVTQPHADLFRLSINDETLEDPNIVIGIGRLFVNISKSQNKRISKWTCYEVFVDKELALWMVFDRKSTEQYTGGCRVLEKAIFDIACFLPSLRSNAVAEFNPASKKVQETRRQGKIKVDQLDRREADNRLFFTSLPREPTTTHWWRLSSLPDESRAVDEPRTSLRAIERMLLRVPMHPHSVIMFEFSFDIKLEVNGVRVLAWSNAESRDEVVYFRR